MKKTFLIFIVLCTIPVVSQTTLDVIAYETCSCINSKKIDFSKVSKQSLEANLGICMMTSYSNHYNELQGEDKVELSDTEGMRNIGKKIAIKMLNSCPDVLLELGKNALKEKSSDKQEIILEDPPKMEESKFMEGEVVAIKVDQFVTIQLKDKTNRVYNFLMLNYFDSSSLFLNNTIKEKDKIKISYSETELYDPKAKEFRAFKIISGLEPIK